MKPLLDQGMPRSAAALLRKMGSDAVHTGEMSFATAEDAAILERGREDERIIVTLDADFHTLLALAGAGAPSVIRLRIEGLRGEETAALLQTILTQFDEDLEQGAALTVQEGRVRVRRLPLRSA